MKKGFEMEILIKTTLQSQMCTKNQLKNCLNKLYKSQDCKFEFKRRYRSIQVKLF